MKKTLWIALIAVLATTACGNAPSSSSTYHHWIGEEGEVMILTQLGNVFRGEFIDPGFQEFCSVPIVGTMDSEGHIKGVAAVQVNGGLYAKLEGTISGNTLQANWMPTPNTIDQIEPRQMTMHATPIPAKIKEVMDRFPNSFYNWLFDDNALCTANGIGLSRVTPFFVGDHTVIPGKYGYQIGEWEVMYLSLERGFTANEVKFHLQYELDNGISAVSANIQDVVRFEGNAFRYKKGGYEFEMAMYNGFVMVTTLSGELEGGGTADGVYPLLQNDLNFYMDEAYVRNPMGTATESTITKDILSLSEMQFPNAAVMIVETPTSSEPYFTVKAGSNMDDHFVTSFWFHVYTEPAYEIRIYDVALDSEMTLAEWRSNLPFAEEQSRPLPAEVLNIFKKVLTNQTTHYDAVERQNIFLKQYFSDRAALGEDMTFTLVDLDGDGTPEGVIEHYPGIIRVLRYENGTIYGFSFDSRSMTGMKKDGSFDWSNSAFNGGTGRQFFNGTDTYSMKMGESLLDIDNNEESYYIYYSKVTEPQYYAFAATQNQKEEAVWTPLTDENVNKLKVWDPVTYLYSSIPDAMFPIPKRNGVIIPYDRFSPPEEGEITIQYVYDDASLKESYTQQLRNAGFVAGQTMQPETTLWRYDRSDDGASLMVELTQVGTKLVVVMYVNYFMYDPVAVG